jgi:hypothetical protein
MLRSRPRRRDDSDWRGAALGRTQETRAIFFLAGGCPQIFLNRRLPRTTQRVFRLLVCEKD